MIPNRPTPGEYGAAISTLLDRLPSSTLKCARAALEACCRNRKNLFLCGNGGSAANANHLATDLIYGVGVRGKPVFAVNSLSSNPSVLTCLGNDIGYEQIYSRQLKALARAGDLLAVFSGSGNSPNIIRVLRTARKMKVRTIAFLGFDGGSCLRLADIAIHFHVRDMQLVEDLHMITAHLLFRHLR